MQHIDLAPQVLRGHINPSAVAIADNLPLSRNKAFALIEERPPRKFDLVMIFLIGDGTMLARLISSPPPPALVKGTKAIPVLVVSDGAGFTTIDMERVVSVKPVFGFMDTNGAYSMASTKH